MMIVCPLFVGKVSASGTYASEFAPGDRGLVYVVDVLALKSQGRYDPVEINDKQNAEAFQHYLGYDRHVFLERFVKPCYLSSPIDSTVRFPEPGKDKMALIAKHYRVWVNVQDGATSITSPCIGQLIKVGKGPEKPIF